MLTGKGLTVEVVASYTDFISEFIPGRTENNFRTISLQARNIPEHFIDNT
jgi:hypothetical protein